MVIGPTPPGTGVIAPATSTASSKATSPTSVRLPSAARRRLMPTSITVAPGLIQSPRIISGRPTAATTMSAALDDVGQVASSRMGDGDRAARRQQELRHRLADDVRAADTTASRPPRSPSSCLQQIRQPSGVHGTKPGSPIARRPALTGWKPSTSLSGEMRGDDHPLVDLRRQRQLDEDSVDRRIGVEVDRRARAARPG